jgi:hypothetical protein
MLNVVELSVVMLSVIMLSVVMLSVVMLSVVMLSVILLSVILLSVVMLNVVVVSVIMLSVVMLNVVLLSVVAPKPNTLEMKTSSRQKTFFDQTNFLLIFSLILVLLFVCFQSSIKNDLSYSIAAVLKLINNLHLYQRTNLILF